MAQSVLNQLLAEARHAAPLECCGLLLGQGQDILQILPASNVHSSPHTHFEIDPQALINAHRAERAGGPRLIGYYHSHPCGPLHPSATDRAMAAGDGRIWAIIAGDEVSIWRDNKDGFRQLSVNPLP